MLRHKALIVHGGIRHLEKELTIPQLRDLVHGGIRHLENEDVFRSYFTNVHGGIRHLEIHFRLLVLPAVVHGGIRHLEIFQSANATTVAGSWRHTPFRKIFFCNYQFSWVHGGIRHLEKKLYQKPK